MDVSRLSPKHQKYIARLQREAERKKKPGKEKPIKYNIAFDTKLEIQLADQLEAFRLIGRIESWMYHPITVRLADGARYTPDFGIRMHNVFVLLEAKGSWKAKNARDSRTRLHIAQEMFPWWIWVDVTKDQEGFVWKVIGPVGSPPVSIGFAQVEASILRLQGIVQPRLARGSEPTVEPGPASAPDLVLPEKRVVGEEGR